MRLRPRTVALGAGGAIAVAALWWRKHPSACPYGQRFWVQPPHPLITRARLREVLAPQPDERVLEAGPGTGYYTLETAEWVGANGTVEIFDLRQEMLDHTMRRARERGIYQRHAHPGRRPRAALPGGKLSTPPILSLCSGRYPTRAPRYASSHVSSDPADAWWWVSSSATRIGSVPSG